MFSINLNITLIKENNKQTVYYKEVLAILISQQFNFKQKTNNFLK